MDDEWVPNGCSLGAPFTVLVRKLFFMFSEELGFEIICKDTQKKIIIQILAQENVLFRKNYCVCLKKPVLL